MPDPLDRRTVLMASVGLSLAALQPTNAASENEAREEWLNEPTRWHREGSAITIHAEPKTDFWRKTYFGYITDNGHLFGRRITGDFKASVNVSGRYAAQYDQAGLMVRLNPSVWMKCGVEFVDGRQHVSSVFTRDFSDWAGIPRDTATENLWFQLARKGSALTFAFSLDGTKYTEVRQGYLTEEPELLVGVMAAAPEGPGFDAIFREFRIEPA